MRHCQNRCHYRSPSHCRCWNPNHYQNSNYHRSRSPRWSWKYWLNLSCFPNRNPSHCRIHCRHSNPFRYHFQNPSRY